MTLYRKRPPTFEAWQFNGELRSDWPKWLRGHNQVTFGCDEEGNTNRIFLTRDSYPATIGDWIVVGDYGVLTACDNAFFVENYEVAA